jgi:hypothetical protein
MPVILPDSRELVVMELQPLRQPDTSRYGSVPEVRITPAASSPFTRTSPSYSHPLTSSQPAAASAKASSEAEQIGIFGNARDVERISRHLDNGNLGAAIDCFMALVSVVFAGTYVTNTYIPYNSVRSQEFTVLQAVLLTN